MENNNIYYNEGSCIVLYTLDPAITAEGDEDDATALGYIEDAFEAGRATYVGFSYPEKADLLPEVSDVNVTNVYFTFQKAGLVPFNSEYDFKPGILNALQHGYGKISNSIFHVDSVNIKRIDIAFSRVL
jgi:hypothetical protein